MATPRDLICLYLSFYVAFFLSDRRNELIFYAFTIGWTSIRRKNALIDSYSFKQGTPQFKHLACSFKHGNPQFKHLACSFKHGNEGKTGYFLDPCVAVGPGVTPPSATLHRRLKAAYKVSRHGVKPFVEPSVGQPPRGEVRLDGERRTCAGWRTRQSSRRNL